MSDSCSFCSAVATTTRSDDNDIFDTCSSCADAWDRNPGFTKPELKIVQAGQKLADQIGGNFQITPDRLRDHRARKGASQ